MSLRVAGPRETRGMFCLDTGWGRHIKQNPAKLQQQEEDENWAVVWYNDVFALQCLFFLGLQPKTTTIQIYSNSSPEVEFH